MPGFLGARASRPHNVWHSLAHPPHLDRLATPWVAFGLANAVPTNRMDACKLALTLSGLYEGKRMRARRPRSQGDLSSLMRRGGAGSAPGNRYFFMNIDAQDAQDAQDKQDEGLLRGELTPAMIRCGLADAQDYKPVVS